MDKTSIGRHMLDKHICSHPFSLGSIQHWPNQTNGYLCNWGGIWTWPHYLCSLVVSLRFHSDRQPHPHLSGVHSKKTWYKIWQNQQTHVQDEPHGPMFPCSILPPNYFHPHTQTRILALIVLFHSWCCQQKHHLGNHHPFFTWILCLSSLSYQQYLR